MNSTLESSHMNISKKIGKINELVDFLQSHVEVSKQDEASSELSTFKEKINEIEHEYFTNVIDCVTQYYDDSSSKDAEEKYFIKLSTMNIDNKLIDFNSGLVNLIYKYDVQTDRDIIKRLKDIQGIYTNLAVEYIKYNYCCKEKMDTMSSTSQLYCQKCGKTIDIKGMVFEDAQFYSQEGKKTKHGKYDPIKNFHKWMDHILAREKIKIIKADKDKITECIKRDGFGDIGSARNLTLKHIRNYLQELKLTKYNSNAAYLLSIFSGVYPPQLSVGDYNKVTIQYKKTVLSYNKDPIGPNTPYCPYFIYKIAENLWYDDKEKLRILNYIYLKKPNTLMKWDNEWKKICKINGFEFRATDYTKFEDN